MRRFIRILLFFTAAITVAVRGQSPGGASAFIREAENRLRAGDHPGALASYLSAFDSGEGFAARHYYNAALAAEKAGSVEQVFALMEMARAADSEWYVGNFRADTVFPSLVSDPRWEVLADTVEARRERDEKDYDHELRGELMAIMRADQEVRQEYIAARSDGDRARMDSLGAVVAATDSVNRGRIVELLENRGWPGKEIIGNAGSVYFLVLQHSPLEIRERYLPLVRAAAARGDIPMSNLALYEDRIAVGQGRGQVYDTQIITGEDGTGRFAPLEDPQGVDRRRASVGLGPLAEYLKNWNIEWPPAE